MILLHLGSRLASIDRLVEKASAGMCAPVGPQNIPAHPSILWTVQVHVPRARARYRCRTMVVKKNDRLHSNVRPSAGSRTLFGLSGNQLRFGETLGHHFELLCDLAFPVFIIEKPNAKFDRSSK